MTATTVYPPAPSVEDRLFGANLLGKAIHCPGPLWHRGFEDGKNPEMQCSPHEPRTNSSNQMGTGECLVGPVRS